MEPLLFPSPVTLPIPLATLGVLWAVIFGACIGSFLNVVIARVPEGLSIVSPRSRCPKCESEIAWYDNIPLISWVVLRARCRGCKTPISGRYPLVELLIALTAAALFIRDGVGVSSAEMFVVTTLLVAIAFIDLDTKTIPLVLLGMLFLTPAIAAGVAWLLPGELTGPGWVDAALRTRGGAGAIDRLLGALVGGVMLASVVVIGTWYLRKRGRIEANQTAMGWGDPLLLGAIGAVLGWRAIPIVLTLASVQGVVIGVLMLRFGPSEEEEDEDVPTGAIPFGPFLALGALEVAFFGDRLMQQIGTLFPL